MKKTLLLATLLLAAFLRFYRIEAQSLWNDEGNSARLAERSAGLIVAGAAGDIHPPGYYLLLSAWRAAAGGSEFALRGFSAFAGILLVALVYRLGQQYFDDPAALAAALFAAIHPALIYYSQEARMYQLAAALGAAATLAATQWLADAQKPQIPNSGKSRTPTSKSQFIIHRSSFLVPLTALGLYIHYSFAFVVIAVNLTALGGMIFHRAQPHPHTPTRRILHWLALQLLALLLFAPWLPTAARQLTTWPSAREYLPLDEAFIGVSRWLILGPTADPALAATALFGASVLLAMALRRRRQMAAPALWLLTPVGLTLGLGLFSAAFAKFLIIAVPAACLLLGRGAAALRHRARAYKLIALVGVAFVLGPTIRALNNLYFDPAYARADYRGIARYLDSMARPGDAILLNAPNQWEVFTYYHPDLSNVYPVARARPLDEPAQIAELEQIAASHDRLFVLYWGEAQSDPKRVIESWLNERTFKAYDRWYGDVRLAAYAVPRAAGGVRAQTDATFGKAITLEGYSLNRDSFSPGDIVQLTLFWRAEAPIAKRYKVFVHLVGDPAAPPAAQHDGEPGGGLALTTTWRPAQTIADNHGVYLPPDLPPGEYALLVGLYGLDDGARLILENGADALTLATLHVR